MCAKPANRRYYNCRFKRGVGSVASFWEGVLAGYGIAIPVGAIAILIVNTGMQRGFSAAFLAGAGAASADVFFAALAAVSGQALAAALAPFAGVLQALSAVVLVSIGVYGLWQLRRAAARSDTGAAAPAGGARTYVQFLGLTLLNPLTVAYFAALILGRGAALNFTPGERALFVVGAGLASLSWQSLLAVIGALAHRRLSPRVQVVTSLVGNLVVIGLGLRIVLQGAG